MDELIGGYMEKVYIAIDLKSFYASVECVERNLDPLSTNLVVADSDRTSKTICLAVTPSLKKIGIPGRARLFEVEQKAREARQQFIIAKPRMALYMEYSSRIYNIYLKYVAPEDIHVYSIDEVFMDVTGYLNNYNMTPKELASQMILDVLGETGITATAGIGTNLYLCKVAMDVMAKRIPADEKGVRIAQLDEMTYRRELWGHKPITDFWRVGSGYSTKLKKYGIETMGDVARCSVGRTGEFYNEDLLYKLFGVNAELLIDHAWGWEPCTIKDIKEYRPRQNSISSGQVLMCPYEYKKGELVVKEMTDLLVLELVEKRLVTNQIVLTIGYDVSNIKETDMKKYRGEVTVDRYGRKIPKHAHGTKNLIKYTSSTQAVIKAAVELYNEITDENLLIRRITITANHVINEDDARDDVSYRQMSIFNDYEKEQYELKKEKAIQDAVIDIKHKYGKNAVVKGMNLLEGATAIQRNGQIGGHKA